MKLKCFSVFISLLTVMLFVMTEPAVIHAANDNYMPDLDTSRAKSLTIYFYTQINGVDTPIDGAEVAVYKVADLQTHGGSADYTLSEEYSSLQKTSKGKDVTFDGITVTESVQLSEKLADLVNTPNGTAVTDTQGKCTFNDLEQGMYLVREISKSGTAGKFQTFAPYLISVPLAVNYTDVNEWLYDVLSEPKTKVSSDTPGEVSQGSGEYSDTPSEVSQASGEYSKPEESQKESQPAISRPESSYPQSSSSQPQESSSVWTGDASVNLWMAGLWGISLIIVCITMVKSKKKEADENE